jgi:hypothetical protein
MKCPACWSRDTTRADAQGWLDRLAACLLFSTCQCRHCLSRFHVFYWQASASQPVAPVASWKTNRTLGGNRKRAA